MIPLQNQLERGIHELPFYTYDGAVILVAVNRHGRKIGRASVRRLREYAGAVTRLEAELEADEAEYQARLADLRRFGRAAATDDAGTPDARATPCPLSLMP